MPSLIEILEKMAYVYLLGDSGQDNVFKIGMTRGKIENRIKELQTGNGEEIFISSYYETKYPSLIESRMHMKYFAKNKMNEWFYLDSKDVVSFREDCERIEKQILELSKDNEFVRKKIKKGNNGRNNT